MSLFLELKRRNVLRVAMLYVIASWLLMQVGELFFEMLGLPEWSLKLVFGLLTLGFPIALIFSWIYELTPEGIKLEKDIDRGETITQHTGKRIDKLIITGLVVLVGILLADRFWVADQGSESGGSVVAEVGFEGDRAASGSVPGRTTSEVAGDQRISIAVLPFVNMSDDAANEYFSDGIAEELLNTLVKLKGLRVASRTSSFFFKGKDVPLGQIAADLGVGHVLEGSVRKAGNQVRITAQLIDVATDSHLWSETYDRELSDIFAIQSEIAKSIAASLQVALGTASATLSVRPTENLAAYDAYLQGLYFLAKRGVPNLQIAISEFSKAVELDPEFADAYGSLAKTLSLYPAYSREDDGKEYDLRADRAFTRALELDPTQLEALIAKAYVSYMLRRDWETARQILERLLLAHPEMSEVHNFAGDFYRIIGNFKRAEIAEREALALDPLAEVHSRDLAFMMISMGRYREAVQQAKAAVKLSPDRLEALTILAQAQTLSGDREDALRTIARLESLPDSDPVFHFWSQIQFYSDSGDIEELESRSKQLEAYVEAGEFPMALGAFMMMKTGQIEKALNWLNRAYDNNDSWLSDPYEMYLPEQHSKDPRWLEFWQRPGLAELIELRRSNIEQGNGKNE